jgi:hypothetical protein
VVLVVLMALLDLCILARQQRASVAQVDLTLAAVTNFGKGVGW